MKKASVFFHGPEGYNCAQAVLKAFQDQHISQELIDSYKKHGGGRAPGGLCGALFATQALINDPAGYKQIEAQFTEKAASVMCKDILKMKKISCAECVDTAAELLRQIRLEKKPK